VRWNDQPPTPLDEDYSWLPEIATEVSTMGGAQICAAPFLDPFARARRNKKRSDPK
jgi:hypothetical protein